MRKQNGITLIALVITIIVLLILASVTINLTLGERGIFRTAINAVEKQKIGEYLEKIELSRITVAGNNRGQVTLDNLIEQIYIDKIVQRGAIVKINEEKATMTTKEGYVFLITADSAKYIDKKGNIKQPNKVDFEAGNVEVTETPTGWTNTPKIVTFTTNEANCKIQYSYDTTQWEEYTKEIEVEENKEIYVRLINELGMASEYGTYKIEKIDKDIPSITSVTATLNTVTFSANDTASGIIGYKVTEEDTEPAEFDEIETTNSIENKEVSVEKQNTIYYVWVKDAAGNVSAYSTAKTGTQPVTSIEITPNSATIEENETVQLTVNVLPENAYNKNVTWKSSDNDVATVTQDGKVIGVGIGTTTITATANDKSGIAGTCEVTITNKAYTIGQAVTIKGVTHYVIETSPASSETVKLLSGFIGYGDWYDAEKAANNYAQSVLGYPIEKATSRMMSNNEFGTAGGLNADFMCFDGYGHDWWLSNYPDQNYVQPIVSWDSREGRYVGYNGKGSTVANARAVLIINKSLI